MLLRPPKVCIGTAVEYMYEYLYIYFFFANIAAFVYLCRSFVNASGFKRKTGSEND